MFHPSTPHPSGGNTDITCVAHPTKESPLPTIQLLGVRVPDETEGSFQSHPSHDTIHSSAMTIDENEVVLEVKCCGGLQPWFETFPQLWNRMNNNNGNNSTTGEEDHSSLRCSIGHAVIGVVKSGGTNVLVNAPKSASEDGPNVAPHISKLCVGDTVVGWVPLSQVTCPRENGKSGMATVVRLPAHLCVKVEAIHEDTSAVESPQTNLSFLALKHLRDFENVCAGLWPTLLYLHLLQEQLQLPFAAGQHVLVLPPVAASNKSSPLRYAANVGGLAILVQLLKSIYSARVCVVVYSAEEKHGLLHLVNNAKSSRAKTLMQRLHEDEIVVCSPTDGMWLRAMREHEEKENHVEAQQQEEQVNELKQKLLDRSAGVGFDASILTGPCIMPIDAHADGGNTGEDGLVVSPVVELVECCTRFGGRVGVIGDSLVASAAQPQSDISSTLLLERQVQLYQEFALRGLTVSFCSGAMFHEDCGLYGQRQGHLAHLVAAAAKLLLPHYAPADDGQASHEHLLSLKRTIEEMSKDKNGTQDSPGARKDQELGDDDNGSHSTLQCNPPIVTVPVSYSGRVLKGAGLFSAFTEAPRLHNVEVRYSGSSSSNGSAPTQEAGGGVAGRDRSSSVGKNNGGLLHGLPVVHINP